MYISIPYTRGAPFEDLRSEFKPCIPKTRINASHINIYTDALRYGHTDIQSYGYTCTCAL